MSEGLKFYAARLREWNIRINLVSPETLKDLESRHLADCCQLLAHLPTNPQNILDLGTGAGLPGLVLAIEAPQHQLTLLESDSRKCAFLRTIIQELNLKNTQVLNQRLEMLPPHPAYTVITARAFAPLTRLLPQSRPLLAPTGRWLLLKGEAVDEELRACETLFPMTTQRWPSKVPSRSGQQGWILEIGPKTI
jgi:16S rRNA (guanine527-N7)-methyltransferase